MAFDYLKARGTAHKLLSNFGRVEDINFGKVAPAGGPAHNPGAPTISWTNNVPGVVLPADKNTLAAMDDHLEPGTLIDSKIRMVYLSAETLTIRPEGNDLLHFEGARWRILSASTLSPAGTDVLHKVGVIKQGAPS